MELKAPFQISSRLLPALHVGGAWLSLEYVGNDQNRMVYRWFIDLPDGQEFSEADLKSGWQGADTQEMFGCLLSFLGAAAESYGHSQRYAFKTENADLFPEPVAAWAHQHEDELSSLQEEIESTEALISE